MLCRDEISVAILYGCCGCLQLSQKLGCTEFLLFTIEELPSFLKECKSAAEMQMKLLQLLPVHTNICIQKDLLLFSHGFYAKFTVEQLSSLIFFYLLPVISMKISVEILCSVQAAVRNLYFYRYAPCNNMDGEWTRMPDLSTDEYNECSLRCTWCY